MAERIKSIESRFGCKLEENLLTQVFNHLERQSNSGSLVDYSYIDKDAQTELLNQYIASNNLYFDELNFSIYLDEGAEQKVFLNVQAGKVTKLNDAIFYVNWAHYFESLMIHNILFSETKYDLIGFVKINNTIYSVVEQDYISPDRKTNIQEVKEYMFSKGFDLKKRNDYLHTSLGVIIEDLHEENVLVHNNPYFLLVQLYI